MEMDADAGYAKILLYTPYYTGGWRDSVVVGVLD